MSSDMSDTSDFQQEIPDSRQEFQCVLFFKPVSECKSHYELVEIKPVNKINPQKKSFRIYSRKSNVVFKINVSGPELLEVWPLIGIINKNSEEKVRLRFQPMKKLTSSWGVLRILTTPCPSKYPQRSIKVKKLWKEIPPEQITETFVMVHFVKKDSSENETATSCVLNGCFPLLKEYRTLLLILSAVSFICYVMLNFMLF
ncbi:uncharacterized protein LOC118192845 [Stegodyphus dumicola]|uniref:uncharacterized protein LOC118192845 n=1 Tax=Stegodyphus dumicola TaxID=202533 RepID=UPI0015AC3277|nr:uncharacterized protein LOC118192845 [Stegodyphus dumicola]